MNKQVAANLDKIIAALMLTTAGGTRDASDPLTEAAPAARADRSGRQALRELDRAGVPVTFAGVAKTAGISRSCSTPADISSQIRRLRQATNAASSLTRSATSGRHGPNR